MKEHVNNNNAAIMHLIIRTIWGQRTIMNNNNNAAIMHFIIRLIQRPRKMMMLIMLPLCTLLLDRFQDKRRWQIQGWRWIVIILLPLCTLLLSPQETSGTYKMKDG